MAKERSKGDKESKKFGKEGSKKEENVDKKQSKPPPMPMKMKMGSYSTSMKKRK